MRRTFIMLGVLAVGAVALTWGCQTGIKTSDTDIEALELEQVVEILATEPEAVVVDVRIEERYRAAHLPGAINIPLPELRGGDARLHSSKRIIVYAGGWTDPLSAAGVKRMLALGYQHVYEFKGGLEVWVETGNAVAQPGGGEAEGRPDTDR